jgi:hypothetical protein
MIGVSATLGGEQAKVFLQEQIDDVQIFDSMKQ